MPACVNTSMVPLVMFHVHQHRERETQYISPLNTQETKAENETNAEYRNCLDFTHRVFHFSPLFSWYLVISFVMLTWQQN